MIAMALSCNPQLLIADEPTTALDVTIQAQILELMNEMQQETGAAIIMITHDLGVVAEICQNVLGDVRRQLVEYGTADENLPRAAASRTRRACWPRCRGSTTSGHRRLQPIRGQPPNLLICRRGCAFAPRCRCADAGLRRARCRCTTCGAEHMARVLALRQRRMAPRGAADRGPRPQQVLSDPRGLVLAARRRRSTPSTA